MDCRQAQDALGALRDGCEPDQTAAEAVAHATSCPECAVFSAALEALLAMPAPAAPGDLAPRITLAVAAAADLMDEQAALAAAQSPAPTSDTPSLAGDIVPGASVPGIPPWLTRKRLWTTTGAITLAAASIVIAIVVSGQNADRAAMSRLIQESAQAGVGNADVAGAPTAEAPGVLAPAAPIAIPDYVAYQEFAYSAGAAVQALPSEATTAGAIQTALRSGTVQSVTVLLAPGSPRDIILALPNGGYQTFTAVTRTLGSRTFQLRSGPLLDRFGTWPTLPQGYNQPASADGGPYYRAAGTDALGVRVYVLIGQTPELGFGVAPGTPATDPAAGNPNWTWWSPVP